MASLVIPASPVLQQTSVMEHTVAPAHGRHPVNPSAKTLSSSTPTKRTARPLPEFQAIGEKM